MKLRELNHDDRKQETNTKLMRLSYLNDGDSPGDDEEILAEIAHWHTTTVTSPIHTFSLVWDDRQALRVIIRAAYRWYGQHLLSFSEFCQFTNILALEHRECQHAGEWEA